MASPLNSKNLKTYSLGADIIAALQEEAEKKRTNASHILRGYARAALKKAGYDV